MPRNRLLVVPVLGALAVAALTLGLTQWHTSGAATLDRSGCWVPAWGASPQPGVPPVGSAADLAGDSVRDVLVPSLAGDAVRVRVTNAFGTRPVLIGRASIGDALDAIAPAAGLTFAGRASVRVAAGASVLSDPVRLPVAALHPVSVSLFVAGASGALTEHRDAQQVNYLTTGDRVADAGPGRFTGRIASWPLIDRLDVRVPGCRAGTVIALGDSLTDGYRSTVGADARWTDDLARRIASAGGAGDGGFGGAGARVSVLNEGISGNRLLRGGPCCGQSALRRLRRDVLAQPAARSLIVLEGINDIGFGHLRLGSSRTHRREVFARALIDAYRRIIRAAHAAGLRVIGGTLLPFRGAAYFTRAGERVREAVNRWIRHGGGFDAVIDFDAAVADRADPMRLSPRYDSGDHLHPNDAGYQAMAAAVPLGIL